MNEQEKRAEIVAEARSWVGTPYIGRGRVKGGGCDCGSLLLSIAVNCGLADDKELEIYSLDCWAHWPEERYLRHIMEHCVEVVKKVAYRSDSKIILPGSLLLTRCAGSSKFNHGGIVTQWPYIVHTTGPAVEEVDETTAHPWAYREVVVFDWIALRSLREVPR